MQTPSDARLLRDYAKYGNESAFTELVARHTNLVYSAALRQVESPDAATEVAQQVFIGLVRGARDLTRKLAEDASLAGWLCRSARNLSLNHRRDEFRRHNRERQAMARHDPTPENAPDWEELRPVLDEAMAELNEPDYDALVLRFYQNQDLRFVGRALGLSDDAAQKRVSRALDKLRDLLSRRGVTTSAAALSVALTANAVQAAPAGLAVTISTTAALGGTAIASTATSAATKAIAMTTLQKAVIGVTLAAAVGTGVYEARQASNARAEIETLRQQQAPLSAQIQQLTGERDEATSQLAALRDELDRMNRNSRELLKLRGEVGVLRRQTNDAAEIKKENRRLRETATKADPFDSLQPEQLLRAANWGTNSCGQIASRYSEAWLEEITDPRLLLKLGLALYDAGNYQNALTVFQKMELEKPGIALVWQGHMLDLLGKRDEALSVYKKAADYEVDNRHDQYGLVLDQKYIQLRMETPFTRVENNMTD